MSKRRKKTTTRRRRSVRGVGKVNVGGALQQVLGVTVGVALAGYANKLLLQNKSTMIQAAAPLLAGVVVPMFIKSDLGKNIGSGLMAYGGLKLLASQGLAGVGDDMVIPVSISGDDDNLSIMAGAGDDYAMAGDDYAMAGDYDSVSSLAGLSNIEQSAAMDDDDDDL